MPEYTNIRSKFQETKTNAELEFTSDLTEHYQVTKTKLAQQIAEMNSGMDEALRDASQDTREEHEKLMATTHTNIKKEREREEDKKRRKIASLTEPPTTTAPRKAESPKRGGRGGKRGGRRGGRGRYRRPPNNKAQAPTSSKNNPPEGEGLTATVSKRLDAIEASIQKIGQLVGDRQYESGHPSSESVVRCRPKATGHTRALSLDMEGFQN